MLIICPSCATAYRIDDASVGPQGRQVRCARCRTTWLTTAGTATAATTELEVAGELRNDFVVESAAKEGQLDEWSTGAREGSPDQNEGSPEPAPSLVPDAAAGATEGLEGEAKTIAHAAGDIETIAARRARASRRPGSRRRLGLAPPRLPIVILLMMAALAALITWRKGVVRVFPQTAALFEAIGLPVNLRGLIFENLKASHESQDGVTVLVVEGTIVNVTARVVEVPRLRFALRNGLAQEIYTWTALPQRSSLGPNETLPFRTRLASPPGEGRDVGVRFFTRRDLAAGLQ